MLRRNNMSSITPSEQMALWKRLINNEMSNDEIVIDYLVNELQFQFLIEHGIVGDITRQQELVARIVNALLSTSTTRIRELLRSKNLVNGVSPANVPQFSNFASAAVYVPELLCDNDWISYKELGHLLFSESKSDGAATKYGENHGKIAVAFDLAYIKKNGSTRGFSPTLLTKYYCNLEQNEKMELLTRLCYRIPIIQMAVISDDPHKEVDYVLPKVLAESTYQRRRPNVFEILALAIDE